ncbi:MAG: DUF4043 family protein [Helicobacteraceae bacterium]|jgi:N4-gp56 family major capsid protein|nr:DUF4043 family protein [Helicobacteraceae bacterium]
MAENAGILMGDHERVTYGQTITVEVAKESFFRPFQGASENSIIRNNLETTPAKKGAVSVIPLLVPLEGEGVQGNTDFAANQERLTYLAQGVPFYLYGHSVISPDERIEARTIETSRKNAKEALVNWITDRTDRLWITELSRDCTNIVAASNTNGVYLANDTTSITSNDVMTTAVIDELVRRASLGIDGNGDPHPPIKPIKAKVHETEAGIPIWERLYVLLLGTHSALQLKNDPIWLDAQKSALPRSVDHPIFSGVMGKYNGVVVIDWASWSKRGAGVVNSSTKFHKADGVTIDFENYGGSGSTETEVNLFLGATAGLFPQEESFKYYEEFRDMGRKVEFGIDRGIGISKTRFIGSNDREKNSEYHDKDYGVIAAVVAKK